MKKALDFALEEKIAELKLPKEPKSLKKYSQQDFFNFLVELKDRLKEFKYLKGEDSNDVRESYEQFIDDADRFLEFFEALVIDITEAMQYYEDMKEQAKALEKVSKQFEQRNQQYQDALLEKGIDPLAPLDSAKEVEEAVRTKVYELQRRKQKLDEAEEEIAITADILAKKKSEMEEALRHRYTLTESQKQTLLEEKDKILDGIEQWGSIHTALSHDRTIKSKASTIYMYMQLFPEFGQAVNVSKLMFKDKLEGIMIDRAIEGTENPVFSKGEHVGDYKIKDNKLFLELMKAKVPEEYNKKAIETNKSVRVDNLNILSFANTDESKEGFVKDVGVVIDVDETGKVQRITQEKKLREFYGKKDGAEIIEPEKDEE